ncbi:glycosyltransferase family 4 protein [Cutibacterium equinum]|uniref:Glycosyltransferase family 4 protein n=1 Tax=Cutibacterium equinum TaxID=3016342 RepID=A0ABY7R024_9ACTN|nr:glycosyltransferase family 4 protein [Cutibacterium equinum]WCC80134.1 glycosyltransferase family 4 protein [Cutibacterium equinum]
MNERTTLWVSPVSNLAGVARHILDVASVGIPGWRMVVTCPSGPLADRLREMNVEVADLPIDAGTRAAAASLRATIKRVKPDIVHSHLARADFLATMASVGTGVKLVSTEHHIPPDRFMFHPTLPSAIAMETAHHVRLRRFSHVIAVSASTRRDMRKFWHTKTPITVILNGVDRPATPPSREPGLKLLSLARLSKEKNIGATVRAFAHIVRDHPEATLTVAGTGEEEASLKTLTHRLGLDDKVSFPGFVNPDEAMADHDVIIQPSKSDNCSYTLLDAVAQGMGVSASPIGGNPEILPPRCIAEADDIDGLARIAVEQGLHMDQRPKLSDEVPTVRGMATEISRIYDKVES